MGKYFGTDGFRGEANITLTADHAFRVGRFLGWYYGARTGGRARIAVGKDTRRSSYMLEYAITAGLTSTGADVCMLHVTTTPGVAYVTRSDGFDCGIMISASHNPYQDNGIKLINRRGEKTEDAVIAAIEEYLDGGSEVPSAIGDQLGEITDYVSGRNRYVGYLLSLASCSFKTLRIGLDCANGSAWHLAPTVFQALGARTYVINADPDGLNINRNSGSTHISALRRLVIENHLDAGFAYDGDADRCIAVDENGDIVDGDRMLYIFAKQLKKAGKLAGNTVVATVMSNLGLVRALDDIGVVCQQTKVGDRHVYEAMASGGHCLGGEQSGHIILSKYATTGDGILTSIELTGIMLDTKQPLSRLGSGMQTYPQAHRNLRVSSKAAVTGNPRVIEVLESLNAALDGEGRVLLRESGTEPVIRILAEAADSRTAEKYADALTAVIESEGLL